MERTKDWNAETRMIPIDLSGKVALVTGVGDNDSFAWFIAKALQAAGARLVFAVHPRMIRIVEGFLTGDAPTTRQPRPALRRRQPQGREGAALRRQLRHDGRRARGDAQRSPLQARRGAYGDYSIEGLMKAVKESHGGIDILIHSIAFSPEIKNLAAEHQPGGLPDGAEHQRLFADGPGARGLPLMENRPDGASVVGLTYLGGDRVVPHYGGGMSTAKAALQIDAKQLASNLGPKNIRVNLDLGRPLRLAGRPRHRRHATR